MCWIAYQNVQTIYWHDFRIRICSKKSNMAAILDISGNLYLYLLQIGIKSDKIRDFSINSNINWYKKSFSSYFRSFICSMKSKMAAILDFLWNSDLKSAINLHKIGQNQGFSYWFVYQLMYMMFIEIIFELLCARRNKKWLPFEVFHEIHTFNLLKVCK